MNKFKDLPLSVKLAIIYVSIMLIIALVLAPIITSIVILIMLVAVSMVIIIEHIEKSNGKNKYLSDR